MATKETECSNIICASTETSTEFGEESENKAWSTPSVTYKKKPSSEPINLEALMIEIQTTTDYVQKVMSMKKLNDHLEATKEADDINTMLENGFLDVLIGIIENAKTPNATSEALNTIYWVSYIDNNNTCRLIQNPRLLTLLMMLLSENAVFAGKAAFILASLAAESVEYRDMLLQHNIVDAISIMGDRYMPLFLKKKISWLILNLFHARDLNKSLDVLAPLLLVLTTQIETQDDPETLFNVLTVIHRLSSSGVKSQLDALYASGLAGHLGRMLSIDNVQLQDLATHVLGDICIWDKERFTANYMSPELFEAIAKLMIDANHPILAKNALRIMKSLVYNSNLYTNMFLKQPPYRLGRLITYLNENNKGLQSELCSLLSNLPAICNDDQIFFIFFEIPLFEPFIKLLQKTNNEEILKSILAGVKGIWEKSIDSKELVQDVINSIGFYDTLQNLTFHDGEEIRNKALDMMDKFYGQVF